MSKKRQHINVGSIYGIVSSDPRIYLDCKRKSPEIYGASKAGMMHLAENIKADLYKANIKVQLINPGFIKTRLTEKNNFKMPFIMTAEDAAKHVIRAMQRNRFQTNFPVMFSLIFRMSSFLPAFLYFWLFSKK